MRGGNPIVGEIKVSGSKNASLPLMAVSLLTDENIVLSNVPKLSDISTMKQLLTNHGTKIQTFETEDSFKLEISSNEITNFSPHLAFNYIRTFVIVYMFDITNFSQYNTYLSFIIICMHTYACTTLSQ